MLGRLTLFCALTIGLIWLAGFGYYVATIIEMREPRVTDDIAITDGIVVLTGGSERLGVGIDLLKAGKGKKLLISGVNPTLSQQAILAGQTIPDALRECCILLGRIADNTIGNAEETRTWLKTEKFTSIRLVTANYHMPRSLYIFRRSLPDIKIIPHPIAPDSLNLSSWWEEGATLNFLIREYNKYVLVLIVTQFEGWL